jgi:hypothetical protein
MDSKREHHLFPFDKLRSGNYFIYFYKTIKMKTLYKIFIAFFAIIIINSCGKDHVKPVINNFELGVDNSNIGYIGTDVHAEGEIIAEAKIDKILIKIEPENAPGSTWKFETTYTDFYGLKNTDFHEHIEIPVSAKEGLYHFQLTVTDKDGQSTELDKDLELKILNDTIMPVITVTSKPASNYNSGHAIKISGTVTDNIGIGNLYIGLVKVNQDLKDENVTNYNSITLLNTDEFFEPNDVTFNCSLNVGNAKDNDDPAKSINWESGDYYIIIKAQNLGGGGTVISERYPLKVNL